MTGFLNIQEYVFQPFKVIKVKYRNTNVPRPRSGHRIVCDEANIYCFGGYNPSLLDSRYNIEIIANPSWSPLRPVFKELWSYSIVNRKWKQHKVIENMPEELASNAMCIYGKYLMIFGGTGYPFGEKCSNDVLIWRISDGDVKFKVLDTQGQKPPGQYGQAGFCIDGNLLSIGGSNGYAYNCDIYRLDLKNMTWEPTFLGRGEDNEPVGRYRHEVARAGNKLYIVGGGTAAWAFELMEIPTFDLNTKTWSFLTPKRDNSLSQVPHPRKCHSAVQVNTPNGVQVFVAGGSNGESALQDVWRLDIQTLQWTLMQKTILPHPLYFHSATVTPQGCMYIFGGVEQGDMRRTNTMYKVWLCIPSLTEIAFEAMLHFSPGIGENSRSSLINCGIPLHFVDRLKTS